MGAVVARCPLRHLLQYQYALLMFCQPAARPLPAIGLFLSQEFAVVFGIAEEQQLFGVGCDMYVTV